MNDTPVHESMTDPVLTVNAGDRVGDVGEAMLDQAIKSIVVIDDDCHPEGILTSTDFIEIATARPGATDDPVREWMTTDIHAISAEETVATAAETMVTHGISHLPVVGDDGQVVGIISTTDIVADQAESSA
jgi:signal-transduction protein with cAMP-binding, CBS, and nucleotidyltransferase domain